jgi:hypothetical protein
LSNELRPLFFAVALSVDPELVATALSVAESDSVVVEVTLPVKEPKRGHRTFIFEA